MTSKVDEWIYQPANWLERLDWTVVFGNDHPLEIDLGCGKGGFLTWAAGAHPDRNFLGVDRLLGRLRKAQSKARRGGYQNIRLLRIESSYCVGFLVPPRSVSAYHIYFPDPWPKKRHHRRRMFTAEFVRHLSASLVPGGAVNLATDDTEYFAEQQELMAGDSGFVEREAVALPPEAMTEFECQWRAAGKPILRARWELTATSR